MKKKSLSIFVGVVLLATYCLLLTAESAHAFTGPTVSAGSGSGAIGTDAANNVGVGTSTTVSNTKFLVAGSSTDASNYGLKVISGTQSPILYVRNDGTIGIATSTLGAGTLTVQGTIYSTGNFTGNVSGNNISAGNFGSSTGGGNFSFPASLGVGTTTNVSLPATLSVYGTTEFDGTSTINATSVSFNGGNTMSVAFNWFLSTGGSIQQEENHPWLNGSWIVNTLNTSAIGSGASGTASAAYIGPYGTNSDLVVQMGGGGGHTTTYPMVVKGYGYNNSYPVSPFVGIGTMSPSSTLEVVGTTTVQGGINLVSATNTVLLSISPTGNFGMGGATSGIAVGGVYFNQNKPISYTPLVVLLSPSGTADMVDMCSNAYTLYQWNSQCNVGTNFNYEGHLVAQSNGWGMATPMASFTSDVGNVDTVYINRASGNSGYGLHVQALVPNESVYIDGENWNNPGFTINGGNSDVDSLNVLASGTIGSVSALRSYGAGSFYVTMWLPSSTGMTATGSVNAVRAVVASMSSTNAQVAAIYASANSSNPNSNATYAIYSALGQNYFNNTTTFGGNTVLSALAGVSGCLSVSATGAITTSTCSGGSAITSLNGLSGSSQTFSTSTALASGFDIRSSGSVHTLYLANSLQQLSVAATTTGNILLGNTASGWTALTVGTNGKILTASSTATNGVSWEPAPSGSLSGGTANWIPMWTGAASLATSTLLQNGTTTYSLNGFAVGTSTTQSAGTIYSSGNITTAGTFVGTLAAGSIAAGNFATSTGGGNFSFPSSLAVGTTTNVSIPSTLSVYGSGFFSIALSSTAATHTSSTISGTLKVPLDQTVNVNGQIMVENTSATLSYYASSTQWVLSPLKAIPFIFENPTSTEDDAIFIFNETSTIVQVYAVNKTTADTVTFNLVWDPSRNLASSSARHAFSSNQVVTATTTPTLITSLASTTVNGGSVLRFVTTAASSSQFTFTLYYKDAP